MLFDLGHEAIIDEVSESQPSDRGGSTGEETPEVHVKISATGGEAWHRMTVDRARPHRSSWHEASVGFARTACGKPIDGYYGTRDESYDGVLCPEGCFTEYEIKLAVELRESAAVAARSAAAEAEREDQQRQQRHDSERERARARLRANTEPEEDP